MMKASELVKRLVDIAEHYRTVYMWGTFGQPLDSNLIKSRAGQYPEWYTKEKQLKLLEYTKLPYYGFDCVGLIKGILWGWNGERDKSHGGAVYTSNGVPDTSADGMIKLCRDVSNSFKADIPIGAALWTPGHIGVYIGGGLAAECTPAWRNCVQVTAVGNIGEQKDYAVRTWQKWGLLPWVDYETVKDEGGFGRMGEDASEWARDACAWAVGNKIINGDGAGNYYWQAPVTRETLALVLYNMSQK